jgi:hypothetical protein
MLHVPAYVEQLFLFLMMSDITKHLPARDLALRKASMIFVNCCPDDIITESIYVTDKHVLEGHA